MISRGTPMSGRRVEPNSARMNDAASGSSVRKIDSGRSGPGHPELDQSGDVEADHVRTVPGVSVSPEMNVGSVGQRRLGAKVGQDSRGGEERRDRSEGRESGPVGVSSSVALTIVPESSISWGRSNRSNAREDGAPPTVRSVVSVTGGVSTTKVLNPAERGSVALRSPTAVSGTSTVTYVTKLGPGPTGRGSEADAASAERRRRRPRPPRAPQCLEESRPWQARRRSAPSESGRR